jgi:uncharacterized membrane protein YdjX (TVP38/TMEM64 family)
VDEQAGERDATRELVRKSLLRVGLLLLVTIGLLAFAHASGLEKHLTVKEMQERMAAAGWWGPVGYLAAFALGELIHIPGTVFVAAAVVAYGRVAGTVLAYVGAVVSLSVSFLVVRSVGGQPLTILRWAFVRRLLQHLDDRPVTTVILLRLVLWLTPQVNYALAFSRVGFRSYFVGSVVGLLIPVVVLSFFIDSCVH